MTTLVLSEDGRVEIPADIRTRLSLKAGDVLDARVEDGALHLRPKPLEQETTVSRRGVDIGPWIGAGRSFASQEEVDAFIRAERDSWG